MAPYVRWQAGSSCFSRPARRGETIRDLLRALQSANGPGSQAKIAQIKADLHRLRLDFQNEINSLFERSDFAAPYITGAMAIELAAAQAEGAEGAEISQRLRAYDARLAAMQDPERPGSLHALRDAMEKAQSEDEKKIAKALNGADGPIVAGDFDWYAFVQMAKRRVKLFHPGRLGPPETREPAGWSNRRGRRGVSQGIPRLEA
jgi:hypothetical protein